MASPSKQSPGNNIELQHVLYPPNLAHVTPTASTPMTSGQATPTEGHIDTVDSQEEQNRLLSSALAPFDKGRKAWTFVLSGFVVEMLLLGFGSRCQHRFF